MAKVGRPRKEGGAITPEGYIKSGKDAFGEAYVHRQVGRIKYPEDEQECHWCTQPVFWDEEKTSKYTLIIDHIDEDRANNDPANLVASCQRCNLRRGKGLPVGEGI